MDVRAAWTRQQGVQGHDGLASLRQAAHHGPQTHAVQLPGLSPQDASAICQGDHEQGEMAIQLVVFLLFIALKVSNGLFISNKE